MKLALAIVSGLGGAALLALGLGQGGDAFLRAYLLGFFFWLGVALGSLAIILIHELGGGAWGRTIRPYIEPAARTIPLLALLFIPIALRMGELYPWAHADGVAHDELLRHKAAYLNVPFFLGRAAFYFVVWMGLALVATTRLGANGRAYKLAGPGLILYGLTMTFASVDWVMSLDPHWFSTIFGLILMTGQVLSAFALAIAAVALAGRAEIEPLHDLGKLLLAFVMVWAYLSFSQFLIIWSGNIAEEIPWYLRRLRAGWQWLAVALIVAHFALPFLLLLSRAVKRSPRAIAGVALFVFLMRVLDLYWHVGPELRPGAASLHWADAAMPVGVGGLWFAAFGIGGWAWKRQATSA